jgi:hypothetical protein
MNHVDRLVDNYRNFVGLPWPRNLAGCQRVWFAVYPTAEERRLRAKIREFEIATADVHHGWSLHDITDLPARWLASLEQREEYFDYPDALESRIGELREKVVAELREACRAKDVDDQTVVAVLGAGSLFGFLHVSAVIAELEDCIAGRLLVFFPGTFDQKTYRFMDARNGFNYMATPITSSERMDL